MTGEELQTMLYRTSSSFMDVRMKEAKVVVRTKDGSLHEIIPDGFEAVLTAKLAATEEEAPTKNQVLIFNIE